MPVQDTLTPLEASYIATNSYFSLKDWIKGAPSAGVETRANVQNRVLGAGNAGTNTGPNTSLKGSDLGNAKLKRVFAGTTGAGTSSGFGYVLACNKGDRRHIVIATRGTRPELGAPDILTDLRASMSGFGEYGLVHKGFKTTFDSVIGNLARDNTTIMDADVVHCVGHSLGGAVATLVAAHFASLGKSVKLYTFGSPRVGAFTTYSTMHKRIGKDNIFRTAHDLDPVTLIGPFPYIHVNPSPSDPNNFTLISPTGSLLSTANHDMSRYIDSVGSDPSQTWENARALAAQTDHDNCVLAKWLLHEDNNPGWVQYASAKTLGILFKLFSHVLRTISTSVILGLTAVDLLAEMLYNGLCKMAAFAGHVFTLLRHAATWAGIKMAQGADFTAAIIRAILNAMLGRLGAMAAHAINTIGQGMVPLPLIMAGGFALADAMQL
jgi:pimeloyl-ACP methyl ester carboxylesterase